MLGEVHGVPPEEDVVCAGEDVPGDAHAAGDVGGRGEVLHAAEDDFPRELEEFAFVHWAGDAFLVLCVSDRTECDGHVTLAIVHSPPCRAGGLERIKSFPYL